MEIIKIKNPVSDKDKQVIFDIIKDRKFFAVSIRIDDNGNKVYQEHHAGMSDEEVVFGSSLLIHCILNGTSEG